MARSWKVKNRCWQYGDYKLEAFVWNNVPDTATRLAARTGHTAADVLRVAHLSPRLDYRYGVGVVRLENGEA